MRFPLTMVAWTLALAAPSAAQIGNPAGVPPGTAQSAPGVPAPHETNVQDRYLCGWSQPAALPRWISAAWPKARRKPAP
jgi:hypothetical protein